MIIETLENNDGFLYLDKENNKEVLLNYEIVSYDVINEISIYSIKNHFTNNLSLKEDFLDRPFKCKHGNFINFLSCNLLPSEDWQELIDCWSCHNNEFAGVKDLQIKVRSKGILVSSFFFLINNCDLPTCCQNSENVRKIWFNEILNINHKKIIFDYLSTFFKYNNLYNFKFNNKIYEMKYFYNCKSLIINDEQYFNVIKIGLRENENIFYKSKDNQFINEFYLEMIYKSIFYLKIDILGYETGFLYF